MSRELYKKKSSVFTFILEFKKRVFIMSTVCLRNNSNCYIDNDNSNRIKNLFSPQKIKEEVEHVEVNCL